jgi:hypothetical protein
VPRLGFYKPVLHHDDPMTAAMTMPLDRIEWLVWLTTTWTPPKDLPIGMDGNY